MSLQSGRYVSSLARSPALLLSRQRLAHQVPFKGRMVHQDAHEPLPFSFKNKKTLPFKFAVFYCTGLFIPFIAVYRSLIELHSTHDKVVALSVNVVRGVHQPNLLSTSQRTERLQSVRLSETGLECRKSWRLTAVDELSLYQFKLQALPFVSVKSSHAIDDLQ
ncbi:hypothetical protein CVT26_008867 [Gymnopilus dilepis]|uniref:Uncharacterized protein n=1 Tax=Gymnopilus dilepis TaxID=231916 RepID=A0A409WZK1_9AGAR|nr:hypothetical protein CVT26_008867 [Gymnopilus dilepis]